MPIREQDQAKIVSEEMLGSRGALAKPFLVPTEDPEKFSESEHLRFTEPQPERALEVELEQMVARLFRSGARAAIRCKGLTKEGTKES